MPLQRLAGEVHRIYKIRASKQFAAAEAANIKQTGGEGYTRNAVLLLPIVIQLTCCVGVRVWVVWLRVWLDVGADTCMWV